MDNLIANLRGMTEGILIVEPKYAYAGRKIPPIGTEEARVATKIVEGIDSFSYLKVEGGNTKVYQINSLRKTGPEIEEFNEIFKKGFEGIESTTAQEALNLIPNQLREILIGEGKPFLVKIRIKNIPAENAMERFIAYTTSSGEEIAHVTIEIKKLTPPQTYKYAYKISHVEIGNKYKTLAKGAGSDLATRVFFEIPSRIEGKGFFYGISADLNLNNVWMGRVVQKAHSTRPFYYKKIDGKTIVAMKYLKEDQSMFTKLGFTVPDKGAFLYKTRIDDKINILTVEQAGKESWIFRNPEKFPIDPTINQPYFWIE